MARRNSLLENRLFKFLAIAILLLIFVQLLLGLFGLAILGVGEEEAEPEFEFETEDDLENERVNATLTLTNLDELDNFSDEYVGIYWRNDSHVDEDDIGDTSQIDQAFDVEWCEYNETEGIAEATFTIPEDDDLTLEDNEEYYVTVYEHHTDTIHEYSFVYNERLTLIGIGSSLWDFFAENHFYLIVVTASLIVIGGTVAGYVSGKRRY